MVRTLAELMAVTVAPPGIPGPLIEKPARIPLVEAMPVMDFEPLAGVYKIA
jgi:hypothetical protein